MKFGSPIESADFADLLNLSNLRIKSYMLQLQQELQRHSYAGWDPYDGMNSSLVKLLSLRTRYGRIAWTQFFRRCPVNLRPLFRIPRRLNAKGIGLLIESFSKLYGAQKEPEILSTVENLIEKLKSLKNLAWSGACWGYPFDWQSQAAFVPEGTPTVVNTSFIGHALLDCHAYTGSDQALEMALAIPPFLLKNLNRKLEGSSFCFSYTPLDHNFVHNANMLGASLLLRLAKHSENSEWMNAAQTSMAYSVGHQRPDGSWPYAETSFQNWIDSFHTGFNLEALRWFIRLDECPKNWKEAYAKGVRFYADNFFLADGTPKYYHDRIYPIDIHAPAEAVYFFSGEGSDFKPLTEKTLAWMMKYFWNDRKGYFYFRKTRLGINRIDYMRWSQAWGMRALTEYYIRNN